MSDEKLRYSDEELAEFKTLILEKLENAQKAYDIYQNIINHKGENDINDTSRTFNEDEGGNEISTIEAAQLADRQLKFIKNLQNALLRIENKTYGIDAVTGQLIPKERLLAVPHATKSVETKNAGKR